MVKSMVICTVWSDLQTASFRGSPPLLSRKTHKWQALYPNFFFQQESTFFRWFRRSYGRNKKKWLVSKANIVLKSLWNLGFALKSRCGTKVSIYGDFELQTSNFLDPHPVNMTKSASFERSELKLFFQQKSAFFQLSGQIYGHKMQKNACFWS